MLLLIVAIVALLLSVVALLVSVAVDAEARRPSKRVR